MKLKITETFYVAKQLNKKQDSTKVTPTIVIQKQSKTKIVRV
jgi:hypothetical protein